MSKRSKIAIYLRLSKEDEDMPDESNSITNQRMMLRRYVQSNFKQYELKEFSDDGFSGTNFQRPGAADMLKQMRDGEIDCVIVKDFSRFSRDYIELGSYLEQIFPFLGVRFISLNDNYDSAAHIGNTTGLETAFKGLVYDLYSKDLSLKVKSSLRTRQEQGQYVSANTPFGYMKAPEDRHRLIIAEDEAEVVRKIFSLALEGKTSSEIAKLFNQEKVRTPIEYKIEKKQTRRTPSGSRFQWSSTAVCAVLKNPVYAGDMVYGKYDKDGVGGKNHLKPRSEWKVYKDHHAAIISRDDFEKIQKQRSHAGCGKTKHIGSRHPLQGKVFCGGCKMAMTLRKRSRNPCFCCKQRYVYADAENCADNINLMFLEQVVLYRIEAELSRQENLEKWKLKKEDDYYGKMYEKMYEKIDRLRRDRDLLLRRKAALQRKRLEDYERFVFHKDCKFQTDDTAVRQTDERIDEICHEISKLEKEVSRQNSKLEKEVSRQKYESAELFSAGGRTQLTTELAEALIHKIVVYDEEHIEIEFAVT